MTSPLILPDRPNPERCAAEECRITAAKLRAAGYESAALVMERNAAEIVRGS